MVNIPKVSGDGVFHCNNSSRVPISSFANKKNSSCFLDFPKDKTLVELLTVDSFPAVMTSTGKMSALEAALDCSNVGMGLPSSRVDNWSHITGANAPAACLENIDPHTASLTDLEKIIESDSR